MRFFFKLLSGAAFGIAVLPYIVIPKLPMPVGCNLLSPYFSYTDVDLLGIPYLLKSRNFAVKFMKLQDKNLT
jgi:hypothetical protein